MNATEQSLIDQLAAISAGPDLSFAAGAEGAAGAAAGTEPTAIVVVALTSLRVRSGYNVRLPGVKREARVVGVLQSILANGFLQDKPLTCMRGQEGGEDVYFIVAGHTRFEAVRRANEQGANITHLPVICLPAGTSEVTLTMDLVLSNNNEPLGMYEQGIVNERLVADNLSVSEIARRQGYTEGHIRNTLELRAAPVEIVGWLADDVISETFALNMLRKHGDAAVQVIARGLEKATALGKGRVTAAAVDGPKIPAQVGAAAVSAVESFVSKLDPAILQMVQGDGEGGVASDDDAKIVLTAGALRELMGARKQIAEFRESVVQKEGKAKERLEKAQAKEAKKAKKDADAAEKEAKKKKRLQDQAEKEAAKQAKKSAPKAPGKKAVSAPSQKEISRSSAGFEDAAQMHPSAPAPMTDNADEDGRVVDRSDVDAIPDYD